MDFPDQEIWGLVNWEVRRLEHLGIFKLGDWVKKDIWMGIRVAGD